MRKKLIFLLIAFTILSTVASACTASSASEPEAADTQDEVATQVEDEPEQDEERTLSMLYLKHWVPGADAVIQERAEACAAEQGFDLSFEQIAEKDFEFKITSAVENSSGPDIALFRASLPILYQDSLLDISDVAQEIIDRHGEFYSGNTAQSFTGEKWVTIPLYSVMAIPMYRTDLFDEAGVSFPDNYDQLVEVGQAVNNPAEGLYAFGTAFSRSRDGILFTQGVLWSFGSEMVSEDGESITFNSPETLAALEYIVDLYEEYQLMPPGVTGWDDSSNNKAWASGQLAMTTNAPSIYYQLNSTDDPLAEVTAHAQWPAGPAGRAAMLDTYGLGVLKYTEYPEESKAVLGCILQEEGFRDFYTAGQGFQNPTLEPFTGLEVFQDPKLQPIMAMLPEGRSPGWPGPVTRPAAEVEAQGVITDMVARVLVDGLTPQESLDEATRRIEEIYARYE